MFRSGKSLVKYVIAFFLGLLCAMPCLWAPACLLEKHMRENLTRSRTRIYAAATYHISLSRIPLIGRPVPSVQEPEELNSATHEIDPEAALPNYADQPSPSAPIPPPENQDGFDAPPSYDAAMRGES